MRNISGFMLRAAVAVAFASAISPLALGQNSVIENAKRPEMERRAGEDERRVSTWELRMAGVRKPPEKQRDATLAYAQIREDYKQIQVVNNNLARLVAAGGALEGKQVEKSVSEIKKCAVRLKENLVLPEAKKPVERLQPESRADAQQLKSSLTMLDKLVMEFINNPIFEQTKTVDVQMGLKARHALEEIIEVSDRIRKSSEKAQKLSQKKQ